MKIAGFHSGHECCYCVLEDGIPIIHAELERYARVKEPFGDGLELLFKDYPDYDKIKYFGHSLCTWKGGIRERHPDTYKKMWEVITKNDGNFYAPGHHEAHAANAFFSSNYDEALIVTIDGGGRDYVRDDVATTCFTAWVGKGNKIEPLVIMQEAFNIGAFWASMTRDVFGLSVGYPKGNQCGTIMAMAAFGEPRYAKEIEASGFVPWGFNFQRYKDIADVSEQNKFDIAASLQQVTEDCLKAVIGKMLEDTGMKKLCLSGGVALNSASTGKMFEWFGINDIYVCPVPYDAGLALGSAQYIYHQVLDNPRIKWEDNATPYLGKQYGRKELDKAINEFSGESVAYENVSINDIITSLEEGKIIAVFNGKSESGRRALGNRSILADPRSDKMKDLINEKVKHRQWFRPFAPAILREDVKDWFVHDIDSPYMGFCIKFKDEVLDKIPAVLHKDNTGRLQTVTEKDNKWFYELLKRWKERTGVPILLNTSFNDREPIVETPSDAIKCFLGTNIDWLYFAEDKTSIGRK